MPSPIRLSIVFLNYNRLHETRFTVERLAALCSGRDDIEVIAVDNGSADGTAEYLRAQKNINSVLLQDNTGIAGYNRGFEIAKGDYILVLDDDSCPENLQALELALARLEQNPEIGVIACRIISPDGSNQWSWHLPASRDFGPSPFFIGCGFLIRRPLFRQIGWYPEAFFLYQNEIEVSFQTRLHGFAIYYDPDCVIVHRGIPTQRPGWRRIYFPTRNTIWLLRRYFPQPEATYLIISRMIIGLVRAIRFGELGHYYRALRDAFSKPVQKSILPPELRADFSPFFRQNSLIHQLLRRT